jgi:hypothetical protein
VVQGSCPEAMVPDGMWGVRRGSDRVLGDGMLAGEVGVLFCSYLE